ncbi:MAG: type VI secretion system tip protein TssI/VgrG [Planctomycetota bacterium]
MPPSTSSDPRVHQVKCSLPNNAAGESPLVMRQLSGKEALNKPFEYKVDLLSEVDDIDPDKLLGEKLTVSVRLSEREPRYFNGYVTNFAYCGKAEGNSQYKAELRPWFWVLSRNSDCRIFQEMTVPDIFQEVCKNTHGFSDFKLQLSGNYRTRDYCVQYRESDMEFLSRLLEEEGISFYFEHTEDKHTMVLCDANSQFPEVDGDADLPYRTPGEARLDTEHVSEWRAEREVQTGAYVLDDYDFTKPRVDLEGRSAVSRQHSQAEYEQYDYPGLHWEAADGEALAKIRIQEQQSRHKRYYGKCDHRGFSAGRTFNLVEFPRDTENDEYIVVAAKFEVESAEIEQMRDAAENRFDVEFEATPKSEPYRPPRLTAKPFVRGPQTAVVTGPSGEEIWTDQYARVKVQFHWDREGQMDENSSCWIRVSQQWAGKTWGAIQIPRIGQEVVVDFLEGDPDRPLITGRVYNDIEMPPYALPDNQTQSGVKSRSTKGGSADNFNELRFEDKLGEEHVYFHAEKDFERVVENNDVLKVGFDKQDPGDQSIEVHGNRTTEIATGNDSTTVAQGNQATTVSQGNHTLDVSAGQSTITACQKITLSVGGSSVTIEPAKITLSAPEVVISGSAKVAVSGAMADVSGSATLNLTGGIVKIN